ncbi:MAP7 domain-containing protein 1-like [Brachypodium distachyon]|uniref:MAP7 domain-containing protein 1-like n=1 Tax=Brachypodium distachyon TaxID=15368 RepID=UPI000D0DA0DA|nr:MAP7 domain-containing protein 1-like [Brachypodium distachyon]|eukprot:XP_024310410.1 MAP7 domain-containing protein 1-like [Brachypodium distachyon]
MADKINLPGFEVGPPEEKRNWSFDPKETNQEVKEIHAAILELKEEGMMVDDLFALQGDEDGKSPDKCFVAPRLTIDHEDPDSEDFMPIFHAGPRTDSGERAAEASEPAAAAAPVREKRAVAKCPAEKDLSQNVKRKKIAARGPKPKPLIDGEALTATQSRTCIASEIPAAPTSRAEVSNPATGENETAADPTTPAREVGPSADATVVGQTETPQTETPAAGVLATEAATEAAPTSAVVETPTELPVLETPQQPAAGPQGPQGPQPTPTPPPPPSRPVDARPAAARAKKAKGLAATAELAAQGSAAPRPSGRPQEMPLRTTSGHSWASLGQSVMDWNSADHYEFCMNKRTAAFKTLLTKYKKLETEHKALKAKRESQAGDNAQVAELLKRFAEVQDEKTRLAEQHREEITRLQAQIAAQAEAHKTEVSQLTSALSSQADEKIRLESEVKKGKDLAAQLETRATAVELEDAEKTALFKVVRHELIKIDNMLTKFFPTSLEHAQETVKVARRKRDPAAAAGEPFEERAYSFIQYADVHMFVEGPTSETDAEMTDGEEEEAAAEEDAVESASTGNVAPSSGTNPSVSS